MLDRAKADLVHTHITTGIDLIAETAENYTRIPMVWTLHYPHCLGPDQLLKYQKAIELVQRGGGRVTAVSQALARHFVAGRAISESTIEVAPVGVDLKQFSSRRPRDPGWRRSYSIPVESIVLGGAGRIEHDKGFDTLIAALAIARSKGQDVHVVIAGSGTQVPALRAAANNLGVLDRVHLAGEIEDMASFYRELDVFVMPSRFEGFGLVLVEALASGVPSISSPVGAAAEVLTSGGGLLVPPGAPDELAEAIIQMASPFERALHSASAQRTANRYSVEAMIERYFSIYSVVLASRVCNQGASIATEKPRVKVKELPIQKSD